MINVDALKMEEVVELLLKSGYKEDEVNICFPTEKDKREALKYILAESDDNLKELELELNTTAKRMMSEKSAFEKAQVEQKEETDAAKN